MVRAAMTNGATSVRLQVAATPEELPAPTLRGALDELVWMAERELDTAAGEWTRDQKQAVVRMLHERGAFLLRGAVDDIAEIMGVSRITIYN
ncbi:MAG: DNA-binding protein, partial [Actinobacteria bacterium]|nr:DNA-binding protein [Actinomycetota bacterium]NIS28527.1 DNA-binding protein [Actinomycetota bacterium]NIT93993.1 DNA-binding protein [Actinomycetota bacterium]NIU17631.1 DNA-binding protein [Actinomycetota bacterium]NIU63998.1 DNA-binding protein [Actinomycetota bacterium]